MEQTSGWTTGALTTLMHGLSLSPSDASQLLPHRAGDIAGLLLAISRSLNNPAGWTQQRHTRAVLKSITGRSPPRKPRKKRSAKPPKHRISLQLVPATPHDDAKVRGRGAYPFLEVVLKGGRRVWDVMKHLYEKWGLPVVVEVERKIVCVDALVCELVERGCRTVRIPYRVLEIDIDWAVLGSFVSDGVRVVGKRRVSAPRDDDLFWTAGLVRKSSDDVHVANETIGEGCVNLDEGIRSGEEAVMTRLRTHLENLDGNVDNSQHGTRVVVEECHDPAVIPERFLTSCSRFDLVNPLPDSMLSIGKSREAQALQVMNDALDLRDRVGDVDIDLRCDERLDGEFLDMAHHEPSLGLSALFRE